MELTPDKWDRVKLLFEEAVRRDPEMREAFLVEACPQNDERALVKSLVLAHMQADHFLLHGSWKPTAAATDSQAFAHGDVLAGRFQVERLIAKGGMGEVYEARDLDLKEDVAIKTIRPAIFADPRTLAIFKREVRLAKQVTHRNICRIFDLFRHVETRHQEIFFVSMELLRGETLAERLERSGRLTTSEALPIISQLAVALAAAHEAGIVHRDLKPGNVVLVPARVPEGVRAVVTDFGLAFSSLDASQMSLSDEIGRFFGTPAYMSPEQVEGHKVTPASDIYALGLVIYQMVTGTRPFQADSAVSAALMRLSEDPMPPRRLVPDLERCWEETILKCLERRPERRFTSAEQVVKALQGGATQASTHPELRRVTAVRVPSRFLYNHWIWVCAFSAALILALGMYFHSQRPQVRTRSDAIVLADFVNTTGEPIFDGTLRQALRVKLEQSPFLNLMQDQKIRSTLRYMRRPDGERLTLETSKEICLREGGMAVLLGTIAVTDYHYRIGLNVIGCANGKSLATAHLTVDNRQTVLEALDEVADLIRRQLREPTGSIERFNIPIGEATTGSLEALKAFVSAFSAWNTNGGAAAIPFFKRAIELDPNFAMAYAHMGTVYGNLGEDKLASDFLKKAFDRRDRVTEWERFYITSHYYAFVTGEIEKETDTYERWKQIYPSDAAWMINLGIDYALAGQFEKAVVQEREAIIQSPDLAPPYGCLAQFFLALNRADEAAQTLQEAEARKLDDLSLRTNLYQLTFLRGNLPGLEEQVAAATGRFEMEDGLLSVHSDTALFFGQLHKSRELSRRAVKSAQARGFLEAAASHLANHAVWEAEIDNPAVAISNARSALAITSGKDVRVAAALALARAGDLSGAESLSHQLQTAYPYDTLVNQVWLPSIQAEIALRRHHPDRAIELLHRAAPYESGAQQTPFQCMYPVFSRGKSFLAAGQGEAAAREFRKIIDHRGLVANCPLGALAYLWLARSLAQTEEVSQSRIVYQDFFALWKDADSHLPILDHAKAEYEEIRENGRLH
jgi:serine/threonine protein kinase/tetratricopeptide (TPR) repeat protein